jgi:hypothetical protein
MYGTIMGVGVALIAQLMLRVGARKSIDQM